MDASIAPYLRKTLLPLAQIEITATASMQAMSLPEPVLRVRLDGSVDYETSDGG
jgi:hypothetical protein